MAGVRHVASDGDAFARTAAEAFTAAATEATCERGRFLVVLAGGSTPRPVYQLLATDPALRTKVDWRRVHVYWGDERAVPPDDQRSNFRMAHEALLAHVPVPAAQVHRIRGEDGPERAAEEYDTRLRVLARSQDRDIPRFDLVLLGMGADGHVASLFPRSAALDDVRRHVAAVTGAGVDPPRITLTPPPLRDARAIVVLVSGAHKTATLRAVLEGGPGAAELPARIVLAGLSSVQWLVAG
jgi:6-phosphogluconolactonase